MSQQSHLSKVVREKVTGAHVSTEAKAELCSRDLVSLSEAIDKEGSHGRSWERTQNINEDYSEQCPLSLST